VTVGVLTTNRQSDSRCGVHIDPSVLSSQTVCVDQKKEVYDEEKGSTGQSEMSTKRQP
jgi:hypothetical protein